MWTYFTQAFLYTYPGFATEEIDPWGGGASAASSSIQPKNSCEQEYANDRINLVMSHSTVIMQREG